MSTSTLSRTADHKIHPLFLKRWSPRAYTGEAIPDSVLFNAFEAARWAPSAVNAQPWRFLYAKRDSSSWLTFLNLINPNNQVWAERASVLIVVVSKRTVVGRNGALRLSKTNSFDAGAAWQSLALQVTEEGWHAHAIGGFDREKARKSLKVPGDFAVEVAIAIGRLGDKSVLPPDLQEREAQNTRRPLQELVREGGF